MGDSHSNDEASAPSDRGLEAPPGMPRWLKVSGIIVGTLILLLVVLQLTGVIVGHGPGRHGAGVTSAALAAG